MSPMSGSVRARDPSAHQDPARARRRRSHERRQLEVECSIVEHLSRNPKRRRQSFEDMVCIEVIRSEPLVPRVRQVEDSHIELVTYRF